jgi:hypothetical protein
VVLMRTFLTAKTFLGFQIYFLGGLWKCKGNDKSKGNRFVASPFGLRSCLRQSGIRLFGAFRGAEAPKQLQGNSKMRGSLRCAAHDETVSSFGRDDDFWGESEFVEGFGVGVEDHVG